MRSRTARLPALVLLLLCACETAPEAPAPGPRAATPAAARELAASFAALGRAALAKGDLDLAEQRFGRALDVDAEDAGARLGVARVALARQEIGEARRLAEAVLAGDPEHPEALTLLARAEIASGRSAAARPLLEHAVRADPRSPEAHATFAALTGRAPRARAADGDATLHLATQHPYDPWARLQAARRLAATGQREAAARLLEEGLWLADRDPAASLLGLDLLQRLDPAWAERRVVVVHAYADETVRADPAWAMRLRLLWASLSGALLPALDTVFLPLSLSPFSSEGVGPSLPAIGAAWRASARSLQPRGLLAGFTERPAPRRRGTARLGQAEYLGRRLLVRLAPGEVESRILIHEVLHVYGAIHLNPEVETIMNPRAASNRLDPVNRDLVGLVRDRRFGPGGIQANVFPFVDQARLADQLLRSLRLNLHFRRLGVLDALEARDTSRFIAADVAREAAEMDPELADVARFVGFLLLEQERLAEAAHMLDVAATLYGPRHPKGREARLHSDRIRAAAARR